MDIEQFARVQPTLSEARPTIVQPHQFRAVEVSEGPVSVPKFRAHKWTFYVTGRNHIRLTFHHFDTPEVRQRVLGELEYFLRSALERFAADGASKDDIIHIYLDCNGLDFCFAHNPASVHGTTLGSLLADNAHGLDGILERFSAMTQSGRDIFLDEKTKLVICAFSPITGGGGPTRVKSTSSKVDFFKNNKCVIQVYNPTDSTCFCSCMCIGLAKLEKMNGIPYEKMKKNCQTDMNRHLKEKAIVFSD